MFRHFYILLALVPALTSAQVKPNSWQDHIGISSANSVTKNGSTIYVSNRVGIFMMDEKDMSPRPLNKINGLSDVGIRLLRTNEYNNQMLVVYDNCNLDVVNRQNAVSNYPDFKLKSLGGKKIVNEVYFQKNLAYLACGFGIVVFDMDKMEIRDTYIIGPNGSDLEVYQVAMNDSLIFAATAKGLYVSNFKTRNLNNFQNWKARAELGTDAVGAVINAGGMLLAFSMPWKTVDTLKNQCKAYYLDNNDQWKIYQPLAGISFYEKITGTYKDFFSFVESSSVAFMHAPTGTLTMNISSVNGQVDYGQIRDAHFSKDYTGNISFLIADNRFGFYQTLGYFPYFPQNIVKRNGTSSTNVGSMDIYNGKLALAPSLINNAGVGNYIKEGINQYEKGDWTYLPVNLPSGNTSEDVTSVLYDRRNSSKMWVSSWRDGIFLYENNKLQKVYTRFNTKNMSYYIDSLPRCGGLSMDKDGNVWFAQSDQKNFLGMIKSTGEYVSFPFEAGRFTRKTMIDKSGQIWILHERDGGITVFKPSAKNGVYATPVQNVNYRVLGSAAGIGNLESNSVYTAAEDKDGRVWVGTSAGIRVFYNPSNILTSTDYDGQPIKIVQDGNVELLLGKETVTSIIVDGANNKWCGTLLGGLYCFSSDGQKQLYHFTKDNSPLYADNIVDLAYDESTGDIFIGTETGLQSFRSTIIKGDEVYTDMHAYPNPVRPGYQGNVLVRGLMDNSIVKISDEGGNLVWETKSSGGQIEWPVTNLGGTRVTSGVYIVYGSTTTGEFKALTKVLVMN